MVLERKLLFVGCEVDIFPKSLEVYVKRVMAFLRSVLFTKYPYAIVEGISDVNNYEKSLN